MNDHDRVDGARRCGFCPACNPIVNIVWFTDTVKDKRGIWHTTTRPACQHCATEISRVNFLGLKSG